MLITLIGSDIVPHRRFAQHFVSLDAGAILRVYKCKCGLARSSSRQRGQSQFEFSGISSRSFALTRAEH